MKKHISKVELCQRTGYIHYDSCEHYHKDDFCLLCGYFMEGDRLYMEIHGSNGALNRVKDIDSSQPYVCMECAGQFGAVIQTPNKGKLFGKNYVRLADFIAGSLILTE